MKKVFTLNIIILVLANLLIKPAYLLWIDVKVQNIVGPNTYGVYLSILSLGFILQIVADPGLLNYNTTYISSNRSKLKERFGIMLGLKITLSVIYFLALAIIGYQIGYDHEKMQILKWVGLNLVFLSLLLYLRSNIISLGFYRWDSFFSILDKSLVIIFCASMIYTSFVESFTIMHFIWTQTLALSISVICALVFTHFRAIELSLYFNFKYFRKILKASIPFAWLLFFMTIYTRIDAFMLERLLDDKGYEAGVYASAFRLFDAGNSFAYLFAVLLLPMFASSLNDRESILSLVQQSSKLMYAVLIATVVSAIFWAEPIMSAFYPTYFQPNYTLVFQLMMIGFIPLAFGYIFGTLLTAKQELKKLNRMALFGVFLNVILNYFLIQRNAAIGAATATLVTQTMMITIQIYFVIKIFKITISLKEIGKLLIYLIIVISTCFLIKAYIETNFWFNFAFSIIINLIIALLLGILPISTLLDIFKKRVSEQ